MKEPIPFEQQIAELRKLEDNWDSYGASPISEKAIETASYLAIVPVCNGGIQIELHAGEAEIEIEIDEGGRVTSVMFEAYR